MYETILEAAEIPSATQQNLIREINQKVQTGDTRADKHRIASECVEQLAFQYGQQQEAQPAAADD